MQGATDQLTEAAPPSRPQGATQVSTLALLRSRTHSLAHQDQLTAPAAAKATNFSAPAPCKTTITISTARASRKARTGMSKAAAAIANMPMLGDCSHRRLRGLLLLSGHPCRRKARSEPPLHLLTERNRDGELVLQRRADGACAHLGEQGCTVYEHRPSACRSFDCRAFSAMGLVEHSDTNHRTPHWEFAAPERAPP
jgi:Fe-S-cluster containining protein